MKNLLTTGFLTISLINVLSTSTSALTFGEAVGAGVTTHIINTTLDNTVLNRNNRGGGSSQNQNDFNRGLQDGFNRANYNNPNNSLDYDRGFSEGRQRGCSRLGDPF